MKEELVKNRWTSTIIQLVKLKVGEKTNIYPDIDDIKTFSNQLGSLCFGNSYLKYWYFKRETKERHVEIFKSHEQRVPPSNLLETLEKPQEWKFVGTPTSNQPMPRNEHEMKELLKQDFYSKADIDEALKTGGSVRRLIEAGSLKVKCKCNCGAYLSAAEVMQNHEYKLGHKNQNGDPRKGTNIPKPVTGKETYKSWLERVRMDVANIEARMREITIEADKMRLELSTLKEQLEPLKKTEQSLRELICEKAIEESKGPQRMGVAGLV